MTAETAAVSIGALGAVIAAATGHLAEDEQRLAVAVYRLLSAREPVSVRAAAAVVGTPGISGRAGTITRRLPPRHGAVVPARRSRSGARRRAGPGGQPDSAGWSLR